MTNKNQERDDLGWQDLEKDELGCALNAALAEYSAVNPRSGLEERVLANLRAERCRVRPQLWWRWGVAVVAAAMIVVAVTFVWRSGRSISPEIVQHRPTRQIEKQSPPQVVANNDAGVPNVGIRMQRPRVHVLQKAPVVAVVNPKLDVFPSQQPLSEQEKLLAAYIAQFPERAALVAEARMENLRRDEEEMRQQQGQ